MVATLPLDDYPPFAKNNPSRTGTHTLRIRWEHGGVDLQHSHFCSVADLFVSFFCLGGESVWTFTVSWNAGNAMCKVFKFWQVRFKTKIGTPSYTFLFEIPCWRACGYPDCS